MIWVIIITAAVLVLTGIAVLHGKCDDIIAGYSTMPAEKRQKYASIVIYAVLTHTWVKRK